MFGTGLFAPIYQKWNSMITRQRADVPRVEFIHRRPSLPNLGDQLCSPKHYYEFAPSSARVAIIGGGVYQDFGIEIGKSSDYDHRITWGVGRSIPFGELDSALNLPQIHSLYASSSTRDPQWAFNGIKLIPCCNAHSDNFPLGSGVEAKGKF
jgi:hypothetical protein